jgi:hypothetical protein
MMNGETGYNDIEKTEVGQCVIQVVVNYRNSRIIRKSLPSAS